MAMVSCVAWTLPWEGLTVKQQVAYDRSAHFRKVFTNNCDTAFQSFQNRSATTFKALRVAGGEQSMRKNTSFGPPCEGLINHESGWPSNSLGMIAMYGPNSASVVLLSVPWSGRYRKRCIEMSCIAVKRDVIDEPYRRERELAFKWAVSGTVNKGVLGWHTHYEVIASQHRIWIDIRERPL